MIRYRRVNEVLVVRGFRFVRGSFVVGATTNGPRQFYHKRSKNPNPKRSKIVRGFRFVRGSSVVMARPRTDYDNFTVTSSVVFVVVRAQIRRTKRKRRQKLIVVVRVFVVVVGARRQDDDRNTAMLLRFEGKPLKF